MRSLITFLILLAAECAFAQEAKLPHSFHFGVSTAAHQVEGNNTNTDWWEWEQQQGTIKNGNNSLIATDAWNHVDEDINNMVMLGVDTYRFSIEWAKIEPKENEFNEAELNRYVDLIKKLKAHHIEPMVTLYHFTLPLWVSKQGGWEWDGIADAFNHYVRYVIPKLGTETQWWITINEPMTLISAGYISNIFPPAKNDIRTIALPMKNMLIAHAKAYHSIHELLDGAQYHAKVGLAHHLRNFDPKHRFNPIDRYLAHQFDRVFNWAIPEALITGTLRFRVPFLVHANYDIPEVIGTQDFFGLNYYSRDRVSFKLFQSPPLERSVTPDTEVSDLNWEIYPEGLDRLLIETHERYPEIPIWITENGIADIKDSKRSSFIQEHLKVVSEQVAKGMPVLGYIHWTLNDNFEWAEGFSAHFGLFSMEGPDLKRVPRDSAYFFKDLIQKIRD